MRKTILILFMMAVILLLPAAAAADSYEISDVDMTITFDDPAWWVFTRGNLSNNAQLSKLGTDEETMLSTMEKSQAYLVAIKGGAKERTELLVRAVDNPYINNMNTLTEDEMKALLAGVDENYSQELDGYQSEITELGGCRYIRMTGRYDKDDYDVVQYLTFINGRNYLISAQKVIDYTGEDLRELKRIVRKTEFRLDPEKTENDVEAYVQSRQDSLAGSRKSMPTKIIMTAVVVLVIVFLLWFMNRRRRK